MEVHPNYGVSLCSGIGGIELGLSIVVKGYRTVCWVENDSYAIDVLWKRMQEGQLDDAPIWGDVTTFDGRRWKGRVDILTAGFPCQAFSTASRGRRVSEDRWPDVLRVIDESRPAWVFCENVMDEPIERAALDLRSRGSVVACARVSASSVGAAHRRRRSWLLAYFDDAEQRPLRVDEKALACLQAPCLPEWRREPSSSVLGMAPWTSHRMDRLRVLGNCVVPAVAAYAFLLLYREVSSL